MIGRNDLARHVDKDRQKDFVEKASFLDPKSMRNYQKAIKKFLEVEKKGATKEEAFHESGRFADPDTETGVFRGAAGKPLYELSDENMRVNPDVNNFFDPQAGGQVTAPLDRIMHHSELFSRVPLLGETPTKLIMPQAGQGDWGGGGQYITRGTTSKGVLYPKGEITTRSRSSERDPNSNMAFSQKDTLAHETQHAINDLQGAPGGDNPDNNFMQSEFNRLVHPRAGQYSKHLGEMKRRLMEEAGVTEMDWLEQFAEPNEYLEAANRLFKPGRNTRTAKNPYGKSSLPYMDRYESTAGEVEARRVSDRKMLSAQDRRDGPDYPWLPDSVSEYTPYEFQLLRHGDDYTLPDDKDTLVRLIQGRAALSKSGAPPAQPGVLHLLNNLKQGLKF